MNGNSGPWILLGVCCIWPLLVMSIGIWIDRRIRTHGLESLIPRGWRKQA
jgi:hypothetical protein